jgi:hypothetical protein
MRRTGAAPALVFFLTACSAAVGASGTLHTGSGGTGSAQFSLNNAAACRYTAAIRITKMWVNIVGKSVAKAYLATTMTETDKGCPQPGLGSKGEMYRLRTSDFDGRSLKLGFASADSNAAKHDVTYEGKVNGNKIVGAATFARWDCGPDCNWTIKVPQALTRQP